MAKYRKKPVVIEAVQWTGDFQLICDLVGDSEDVVLLNTDESLDIPTREGRMRGDFNDWIIKGIKGEFYPCKPDIFEATYEKVEDDVE